MLSYITNLYRYSLLGILLVLPSIGIAQVVESDSTDQMVDSTGVLQDTTALGEPWPLNKHGEPKGSGYFVLSGIRLGADLRPLVQSAIDDGMNAWTLYGDLMIRNQWFLTAEYGQMDRTRTSVDSDFFNYRSVGSFYRFGFEYNVMRKSSVDSGLSFGLKYANSTFDQHADYYSTGNGYWGDGATLKSLTEKDVNVSWYEFTVSLKLALWKGLTADFGFAYTIKRDFPATAITKNDIPGWYFNKDDRSRLNFQYRLLYRIPLFPIYTQPRAKKKQ
ncbi:DUF6048 family protein [Flammeovirga agarivorans]|uniref:Outer membrane protein beta-barrel domain-containing protein n=1 Tax=Flammeovirga agarivorans TaxID=2726742 RepID=A0A7X8SMU9_9BACT|nr:DUF6048 family protein [Flammeovirga agarivorans]NLR93133.1 hypothetical protein [Flammeovirga agarivorans]